MPHYFVIGDPFEEPEDESLEEFFGPVISSYSRAQAVADGVLIDISGGEAASLFKWPCAITTALHGALARGAGNEAATYNARLWDVFYMMQHAARSAGGDSDVFFTVRVGRENLNLWGNCGPGDDAAPVVTVGFPEDR